MTQVGNESSDHNYWGRPEQQSGYRPTATNKDDDRGGAADVMAAAAALFTGYAMIAEKPGQYQVRE